MEMLHSGGKITFEHSNQDPVKWGMAEGETVFIGKYFISPYHLLIILILSDLVEVPIQVRKFLVLKAGGVLEQGTGELDSILELAWGKTLIDQTLARLPQTLCSTQCLDFTLDL